VFVLFDGLGSLLWLGVAVGLGYVFAAQIDVLLAALASAGTFALELLLCLLALYILAKWWQRRRLLMTLRMARITVQELSQAVASAKPPVVVDVRSDASRQLDSRIIPSALLLQSGNIDRTVYDIPFDQELVLYCNCPNEISAAKVAKVLMDQGYRRVRPLLGGLDAWDAAGYGIDRVPAALPPAADTATTRAVS